MSVDKKIIERVEKLLRLAAPSSNSEHERASAALEAARLFSEHALTIVPKEKKRSTRTRTKPAAPPSASPWSSVVVPPDFTQKPGWCRSVAARDSVCVDPDCQGPIARGESVWMRMDAFRVEYIHANGPCGW